MRASAPILIVMTVLAAFACGGGTPTGVAGQVTQLQQVAGSDGQGWYVNNPLPNPDAVRALDRNGRPVRGVVITWAVTSGGGSVSQAVDTTDSSGHAQTTHTLGPTAHTQTVSATGNVSGVP